MTKSVWQHISETDTEAKIMEIKSELMINITNELRIINLYDFIKKIESRYCLTSSYVIKGDFNLVSLEELLSLASVINTYKEGKK